MIAFPFSSDRKLVFRCWKKRHILGSEEVIDFLVGMRMASEHNFDRKFNDESHFVHNKGMNVSQLSPDPETTKNKLYSFSYVSQVSRKLEPRSRHLDVSSLCVQIMRSHSQTKWLSLLKVT